MKKGMKILYEVIFYLLLGIFILIMLLGFASKKGHDGFSIGNYRAYNILTGSMSPTIEPGSLIIVKESKPEDIQKNDIITFGSHITGNVTTHRAIKIIKDNDTFEFQTKGDANEVSDPVLLDGNLLVGKVIFHMPYVGKILMFVKKNIVIFIGIILILALITGLTSKKQKKSNCI